MKKKLIIFEEINRMHLPLIFIYRLMGFEIKYFRIFSDVRDSAWLKWYQSKQWISEVEINHRRSFFGGFDNASASKYLEPIYERFVKDNAIINDSIDLYEDPEIARVFKNFLHKKLSRFLFLYFNFQNVEEKYGSSYGLISFVPYLRGHLYVFEASDRDIFDYFMFTRYVKELNMDLGKIPSLQIPFWVVVCAFCSSIKNRLKTLGATLILPFILFVKRNQEKETAVQKFKYAVMVLSERQFENEIKGIDFLIDGEKIKKEEVVFIPFAYGRLSPSQTEYMKAKNLNYLPPNDQDFHATYIIKMWPYFTRLLTAFFSHSADVLETALKLQYYYVKWNSVSDTISVENIISQVTDNAKQSVARDIVFKKAGTQTWKYMDSTGLDNYFCPREKFDGETDGLFMYGTGDHVVTWSKSSAKIFETNRATFQKFHVVDCLWAENVRLIREGKIKAQFHKSVLKDFSPEKNKLVAFFDSTYTDYSAVTFEAGIKLMEDIFKLLNDFPDIYVVLKEKKSRAIISRHSQEMIRIYEKLEKHPRVYLTKSRMSPSEVIAQSDLVVCHAFTSPGFEALSSKTKTIWYDVADTFQGTFYDQVPQLVAHTYAQLSARTRELLYHVSEKEYDSYLERHVKDYCCSYFDGKGITRFREILSSENFVKPSNSIAGQENLVVTQRA